MYQYPLQAFSKSSVKVKQKLGGQHRITYRWKVEIQGQNYTGNLVTWLRYSTVHLSSNKMTPKATFLVSFKQVMNRFFF